MRTFHLFISHSWRHRERYDLLKKLLQNRPRFEFEDHSVTKDDPIHDDPTAAELRAALRRKIAPCDVVLVIAGVDATYSRWINEEIRLAQDSFNPPKPIVAVEPRGSDHTSKVVKDAAAATAKWNARSIVDAIRKVVQ